MLNALLGVNTFTAATLTTLPNYEKIVFGENAHTVDFAQALFGQTVVSFHVGGSNVRNGGIGYQSTAFFVFDAGNLLGGLGSFSFNVAGLSNGVLFKTGQYVPPCGGNGCSGGNPVPEPGAWALMILGFGAAGSMLRRRRAALA